MLRVLIALLVVAPVMAHAEPVRVARPRQVAIAVPDFLFITNHDITFPLPALHVGYQVSAAIMVELGASYLPLAYGSSAALGHGGIRYLFLDGTFAPYGFVRAGAYVGNPDEGDGGAYPFVVGGVGLDIAARGGLAAWAEVGPGLASFEQFDGRTTEPAVYVSLGAGYRF